MDDVVRKLKNIVMDGDMLIDKKAGNVLGPEADYPCYKENFKSILLSLETIISHAAGRTCFML